jgi:hypothetical protein
MSPGRARWKVGQRTFVVEHLASQAERRIVHTDPRQAAAGRAGVREARALGTARLRWVIERR